jgi:hypothetical protein
MYEYDQLLKVFIKLKIPGKFQGLLVASPDGYRDRTYVHGGMYEYDQLLKVFIKLKIPGKFQGLLSVVPMAIGIEPMSKVACMSVTSLIKLKSPENSRDYW